MDSSELFCGLWYIIKTRGGCKYIARNIGDGWLESVYESGGNFTIHCADIVSAKLVTDDEKESE